MVRESEVGCAMRDFLVVWTDFSSSTTNGFFYSACSLLRLQLVFAPKFNLASDVIIVTDF